MQYESGDILGKGRGGAKEPGDSRAGCSAQRRTACHSTAGSEMLGVTRVGYTRNTRDNKERRSSCEDMLMEQKQSGFDERNSGPVRAQMKVRQFHGNFILYRKCSGLRWVSTVDPSPCPLPLQHLLLLSLSLFVTCHALLPSQHNPLLPTSPSSNPLTCHTPPSPPAGRTPHRTQRWHPHPPAEASPGSEAQETSGARTIRCIPCSDHTHSTKPLSAAPLMSLTSPRSPIRRLRAP